MSTTRLLGVAALAGVVALAIVLTRTPPQGPSTPSSPPEGPTPEAPVSSSPVPTASRLTWVDLYESPKREGVPYNSRLGRLLRRLGYRVGLDGLTKVPAKLFERERVVAWTEVDAVSGKAIWVVTAGPRNGHLWVYREDAPGYAELLHDEPLERDQVLVALAQEQVWLDDWLHLRPTVVAWDGAARCLRRIHLYASGKPMPLAHAPLGPSSNNLDATWTRPRELRASPGWVTLSAEDRDWDLAFPYSRRQVRTGSPRRWLRGRSPFGPLSRTHLQPGVTHLDVAGAWADVITRVWRADAQDGEFELYVTPKVWWSAGRADRTLELVAPLREGDRVQVTAQRRARRGQDPRLPLAGPTRTVRARPGALVSLVHETRAWRIEARGLQPGTTFTWRSHDGTRRRVLHVVPAGASPTEVAVPRPAMPSHGHRGFLDVVTAEGETVAQVDLSDLRFDTSYKIWLAPQGDD